MSLYIMYMSPLIRYSNSENIISKPEIDGELVTRVSNLTATLTSISGHSQSVFIKLSASI